MSREPARGKVDGEPIRVGDQVMVRAEVLQSVAGRGALLKIYSETDEMQVWVAEDHLRYAVVDGDLPAEPADGTWLYIDGSLRPDGNPLIFRRDDAEGHSDERRRHDEHWFDVVNQEWIDWPTAVERGAAWVGVRRMVVLFDDEDPESQALDQAMHTVWLVGQWKWITEKMGEEEREVAAAAVDRHSRRIAPADHTPIAGLRWWKEYIR